MAVSGFYTVTDWWFQTVSKILVKLEIFPKSGMKKQMLETMLVLTLSFQLYGPPKKMKKINEKKISLSETVVFSSN